jgi:UDP-N-acetylglucosamine 1-carboxyvinyltransferase
MSTYTIQGGVPLTGSVNVHGAKNAALKLMAASILTEDTCVIRNVPDIKDVRTMIDVLNCLGAEADYRPDGVITIMADGGLKDRAPYELVSQMRASIIVLGPLLARLGRAHVALPGGCNIGSRQIDMHLAGLKRMGVKITTEHGYIEGVDGRLRGARIPLDFPSVGATENVLMAAALAKGTTVIENAAREPEIIELVDFLLAMGAEIRGAGSSEIVIEGVEKLRGVEHTVLPDRIEAGTLLLAGAITGGEITIAGAVAADLRLVLDKLVETGATISESPAGITIKGPKRPRSIDIATLPFPGFPTDLQPLMAAYLAKAKGTSVLTENVFENRFMYIDELNRMGADIKLDGHHAVIRGVPGLSGAPVRVPDLRAGAALIIAGLAAEGETIVYDSGHIERGYENLDEKLKDLGAHITRVE